IYANCGSKSVMIFGSQATDFSQWWLTRDGVVYAFVVVMTIVPALGDMVVAFPSVVSASAFGKLVATWRDLLPLSGLGLSWVVPALVGLVLGLGVHAWRVRQAATSEVVD
ncbi:branched-chain amino acid transport system II carrier protein, partial [Limosilactobacillus fermentum]|uniref:branched-chain amino acid transport system II carrier protein n=2 Tax=Limosilactobacillus fermentum TaxID=1613 RepID=UPI0023493204